MKYAFIFILITLTANISKGQNLYDTAHTKVFAQYLYNTQQYHFAAEEYERLAKINYSNSLDYSIKAIECYEIAYDYKNALKHFEKYVLPHAESNSQYYFSYVKLLIKNSQYNTAYVYCDSVKAPYTTKIHNIKYGLASICNHTPIETEFIIPEIRLLSTSNIKQKRLFPAVTMSAIVPGSGRIYCGYVSEGITTMLRACFEYLHLIYGFRKYGFGDPYPLFFGTVSVCFYIGNIFGTVKSVKKFNTAQKNIRDGQIIDYMYNNLF